MKNWPVIVVSTLIILAALCMLVALAFDWNDCSQRGGVMVETFTGYVCTKPFERP